MVAVEHVSAPLAHLKTLALNFHWTWSREMGALFARIDPALWESTNHNPIALLQAVSAEQLAALAGDGDYVAAVDRAAGDLATYLHDEQTWFSTISAPTDQPTIAYFSMEFGLHESLPVYSGGLGVLAGDHLKSASDLGVPLVAVSLFYASGYFHQALDDSGWQHDEDEQNCVDDLPLTPVLGPDGTPLLLELAMGEWRIFLRAWLVEVGRVKLYLLDANVPENSDEERRVTARLYGGEIGVRIRQELALGIGGYRLLQTLGLQPAVYHMNEGHAAFLTLEHIRETMAREECSFHEARQRVRPGFVFTTHTPVAAGHDYFSPELIERYFTEYVQGLGISVNELLGLGRHNPDDYREYFCMTILALKLAAHSNGVSRLHGEVSREQWRSLWPDLQARDVPIGHITNGVHLPSFIAPRMGRLYERTLGIARGTGPSDPAAWAGIVKVPDEELWATHQECREELINFIHERASAQGERHGRNGNGFDPQVLTIGFARRFATYKRASLIMRDAERLARILNNTDRPVQIVFAGKAHPRDDGGKALIQRITNLAYEEPFHHRLFFLEGYDIGVARHLVQGVDLWLNTPQRPYEASGTSGMKAAANGVLTCSTLDGWWVEAWEKARSESKAIGWAIGNGEVSDNPEHQAYLDSQALYDMLEREIVPAFYERGLDGIPHGWVARMKHSIALLAPYFNTDRMVREYTERFYLPGLAASTGADAQVGATR